MIKKGTLQSEKYGRLYQIITLRTVGLHRKKALSRVCPGTSYDELFNSACLMRKRANVVAIKWVMNPYTCSSGGLLFCCVDLQKY